jgi:acyl-CoA synthetase (AMP-forming)/AMP-acid ligase II/aryl carrier-like protein
MFSVTTFTFDIFYLELFLPLSRGGRVILACREEVMDAGRLSAAIGRHRPSHMQATPAGWQVLLNGGWENREAVKMLVGGEALREGMKKALTARGETWNVYGPTETTIWCSIARLSEQGQVTIGRPLSNTKMYVVDGRGGPVPIGVPGELWIGGIQVARGYWKRPELTAEKFVPDPFTEGGRLYRTGDVGRWLPDGNIEYIGRRDEQVKVRGYRIELGEIETVLGEFPGVRQAVVVVREDGHGLKRLVGYVVTDGEMDKEGVERYLQGKLPEYMVPRQWMELAEMPLTSSGKVDRKALPDVNRQAITRGYTPPRNEVEETLTTIWQEVLGLDRIAIHDNFFELGGDSIMAIQVVSRARRTGLALQARQLFQYPTIAQLSVVAKSAAMGAAAEVGYEELDGFLHKEDYELDDIMSF